MIIPDRLFLFAAICVNDFKGATLQPLMVHYISIRIPHQQFHFVTILVKEYENVSAHGIVLKQMPYYATKSIYAFAHINRSGTNKIPLVRMEA